MSHGVLKIGSVVASSLTARDRFLSLDKSEIFELFVTIFQGLTQSSGQKVGVFGHRGIDIKGSCGLGLAHALWLLWLSSLLFLDDVDVVILIHVELYWERDEVFVDLFGAIKEDSGLELIVLDQR